MKSIDFTESIYSTSLTNINDVNFTRREVDILACLLSARGTSKIATFLSIAPRTVVTHIRNIMLKLECNSRESIIDFLERSQKMDLLRNYYGCLVTEKVFDKTLKEISKLKLELIPQNFILYWTDQKLKDTLSKSLVLHLKNAGIQAEVCEYNEAQTLENQPDHLLIFLLEKGDAPHIPQNFEAIDLSGEGNYYLSFFEILKKIFPGKNLSSLLESFCTQTQGLQSEIHTEPFQNTSFIKKFSFPKYVASVCLALFLLGFGTFIYTNLKDEDSIRSDLITPFESSLLHRPELLNQIKEKLSDKNNIQAIALVGLGGAGKTTLAREYAHLHKANVVWEINAETIEMLKLSFENLAQSLAKSEEDQKILRGIQDIKKPESREEKIIQFIKNHLKSQSNWFLIFDNVEKFSDIKKYFPQDTETWGQGKIILTTRDTNIQNNAHVDDIFMIGELSPSEKLTLFSKIMAHGNSQSLTQKQVEEAKVFLEHIPSYPLDVSLAAYYLKSTNVPYATYLKSLEDYNPDFESIQETLLKEAGHYIKPRYKIISHSLNQIIATHKDFADLLLLISLINSQNIPRNLLDMFKETQVVDNFIYNLKKYSLITAEDASSPTGFTFSLHRSMQAMSLAYLVYKLKLSKYHPLIKTVSCTLESYLSELVDEEDIPKLTQLTNHCLVFLSKNNLLDDIIKNSIIGELGAIYYYKNLYEKGQKTLEKTLINFKKPVKRNYPKIARVLVHLGNIYRAQGNYEKAKEALEKSLILFEHHSAVHIGVAQAKMYLGDVNRNLGDYEKAKILLEQCLVIYENHSKNHVGVARALSYLGNVYRALGNYNKAKACFEHSLIIHKRRSENNVGLAQVLGHLGNLNRELGEYEKSKNLLEQSIFIHTQIFSEKHVGVAWALAHLGDVYRSLGNYDNALDFLMKSLSINKDNFAKDHLRIAWNLGLLGDVYKSIGDYEKAIKFLENSLRIYEKNYGKDKIEHMRFLRDLGEAYCLKGQFKIAENLITKALATFQKNNHPESHKCLECLAELHMKKSILSSKKGDGLQAKIFKKISFSNLQQALEIIKGHYPPDSPHLKRVQMKINSLENEVNSFEKL